MLTLIVGTNRPNSSIRKVANLQQIFGYRNAFVYPVRVFFPRVNELLGASGRLNDPELVKRLKNQAIAFIRFVEKLKEIRILPDTEIIAA